MILQAAFVCHPPHSNVDHIVIRTLLPGNGRRIPRPLDRRTGDSSRESFAGNDPRYRGTRTDYGCLSNFDGRPAFLRTQDTTYHSFQPIDKRGASQRTAGANVFSKIAQLFFPNRTVQQFPPIGNHRQHRSHAHQSVVAT